MPIVLPITEDQFKKHILAMCSHASGESKSHLIMAGKIGGLSEKQCRKLLKEMLERGDVYIARREDWYKTT